MAYKCMICHNDIEKWQSYHCDAQGIKHMACESGHIPVLRSTSFYHTGEPARMTLGDEGISPKKKEDSGLPHKSPMKEGVGPPLGKGERGNHRTKHTKNINGHARQYKVKKEEFDEV